MATPVDIFPDIGIPVVSAVWTYNGLPPEEMSGRIVYYYERTLSSQFNDIQHIESQSLPGFGVVEIFFQPNVNINTAIAQITAAYRLFLNFYLLALRLPTFSCSMRRVFRFYNSHYPARRYHKRNFPISAKILSAHNLRPSPAPRSPRRTAAKFVRFRSISIPENFKLINFGCRCRCCLVEREPDYPRGNRENRTH